MNWLKSEIKQRRINLSGCTGEACRRGNITEGKAVHSSVVHIYLYTLFNPFSLYNNLNSQYIQNDKQKTIFIQTITKVKDIKRQREREGRKESERHL